MALALKYRLLCGSVVITSPFIYQEWYYSQLRDGEHYVAVDLSWSSSADLLTQLRTHPTVAQEIAMRAREWAKRYLTEDGFDCYWLHLIQLAHRHFPAPRLTSASVPIETVVLDRPLSFSTISRTSVEVITVIPSRASDAELMDYARNTWLNVQPILSHRHFFIFAAEDPDVGKLGDADDIVIVECPHGYRQLMQKMVMAYRILLLRFDGVKYFLRADVDSVLPLNFILPLLPQAAQGSAVQKRPDLANCEGLQHGAPATPRWRMRSLGALQCQIECAMDRQCHYFQVNSFGDCATFADACLIQIHTNSIFACYMFFFGWLRLF